MIYKIAIRKYKYIKHILLNMRFIIILLSLTSCDNVPTWQSDIFERPQNNKEYPQLYLIGWKDGCETGASSSASYTFKWKYEYRENPNLIRNGKYRHGWEDAFTFCRKYILQHNSKTLK